MTKIFEHKLYASSNTNKLIIWNFVKLLIFVFIIPFVLFYPEYNFKMQLSIIGYIIFSWYMIDKQRIFAIFENIKLYKLYLKNKPLLIINIFGISINHIETFIYWENVERIRLNGSYIYLETNNSEKDIRIRLKYIAKIPTEIYEKLNNSFNEWKNSPLSKKQKG